MENLKIILISVSPIDIPTAIDSAISISIFFTPPPVTSSTCLFKTCTAGSASTTTIPRTKPSTTRRVRLFSAICLPILKPTGINPTSTATRNITSPKNV